MRIELMILSAALAAIPAAAGLANAAVEAANTAPAIDAAEIDEVVSTFANQLEANFAFPDVARAYAERLRQRHAQGVYEAAPTRDELTTRINADLQAVHPDRHLKLRVRDASSAEAPGGDEGPPEEFRKNGIIRSGWLADGVAYISFSLFPENALTLDALRTFLDEHRSARVLIIDARDHSGGGLAEMDLLFERLFAEPTTLVYMETRRAVEERFGSPPALPTLKLLPAPTQVIRRAHVSVPGPASPLMHAKVFLLTSKETGSAAEHFTLSLKRTGRATVIGETTYGAGNFGGMIRTGEHFEAFVPAGRTYDPDTGEGWEGTGVEPHLKVPAEQALDEALRRAGVEKSAQEALAELQ